MEYLFLSDLHMGHAYFNEDDKVIIMNLLRDPAFDKIFFVGDTIDAWAMNTDDIVAEFRYVIDTINGVAKEKPVVILMGNHDPCRAVMKNIFPHSKLVDRHVEDDFVAFHGHVYDPLLNQFGIMAELFYPIHQWMAKKGIILNYFFRNLIHSFFVWKHKATHNSVVMSIEKRAVKDANKTVVMGHTHIPKIVPNVYVNCGDWTHNKSYVVYDGGQFCLYNLRKQRIERG